MKIELTDTENTILVTTCKIMYADLSEERANRAFIGDLSEKDDKKYDETLNALMDIIEKLENTNYKGDHHNEIFMP